MVLPIGFFMPLPLAMMIPFMGIQSAVMAKQFGEGFQYGKRRISAMSNDEFNALTPQRMIENNTREVREMIPSMQAAVTDMREFQVFIIKEFIQTIRAIIDAGLGKLLGLSNDEINEFVQRAEHFIHGHFEGHGETTTPPSDDTSIPDEGTQLLNPSAGTILSWTITQLRLRVESQLHLYTPEAQAIMQSRYNALDQSPEQEEPTSFEGFFHDAESVIACLPDTFRTLQPLHLAAIKNTTNVTDMVNLSNQFYGDANAAWQNAPIGTARDVAEQTAKDWLAYLVERNKCMNRDLPFKI